MLALAVRYFMHPLLLCINFVEKAQKSGYRYRYFFPPHEEEAQKGDMLPNAYIFKILVFLLV